MRVALGLFLGLAVLAGLVALVPGAAQMLAGEHLAGDRPNYVRNALELASFASGGAVVATALVALGFARGQVREAARQNAIAAAASGETARAAKAEVYARLFNQLMSADVAAGLDVCRDLGGEWQARSDRSISLGAFVCWRMDEADAGEALPADDRQAVLRLLSVVENLGLLVRLELVELDEVFFTFEGALRTIDAVFGDYMRRNQALSGGRESEHALWLLARIANHAPTQALLP